MAILDKGLLLLAPAILAAMAGSRCPAKEPPADTPLGTIPPKASWTTTTIDKFTSWDKDVLNRLKRIDAAARKIAAPNWEYQPYHAKNPRYILWMAWWATPKGLMGPFGATNKVPQDADKYSIVLRVSRDPVDEHRVDVFVLTAYRRPEVGHWGASVNYPYPRRMQGFQGPFNVSFHLRQPGKTIEEQPHVSLRSDLSEYRYRVQHDDTVYSIHVALPPVGNSDAEVRPWLESPKSLRQKMLSRLNRLSHDVENGVRSGDGVWAYHPRTTSMRGRHRDDNVHKNIRPLGNGSGNETQFVSLIPPPPPSGRPLTESEIQEILEHARGRFKQTRILIKNNYREMHAALKATFPLKACLDEPAPGSSE